MRKEDWEMVAKSIGPLVEEARWTARQDDDLQHRIVNFLHRRHVPEIEAVKLGVNGGTVELSGLLHSPHTKWLYIECCRHVAGVVKLIDKIKIEPPCRKPWIN
jgi:osmotically-inducible protein OsmY